MQPIIGLEVHIELNTKSKMFCGCKAKHFGVAPNSQVCPICLGLPGALPVINKKAVKWTIMLGLALNCQIPLFSKFDRKNYFYPDLPKGYQISQYDLPLASNGEWKMKNGELIRIRRVHLEEDTAKLIHTTTNGEKVSLIDFNRSGVPLVEIVTEPDITSALQAKIFLQKLQQIVRYLGISEADMEKGQMRCEPTVNLKIIQHGKVHFTPLVEIKNINSFRFAQKAIDFEIKRQAEEFKKTGIEKQTGNKTTRGWDEIKQKTVLQRKKEEASDYRYFPEPDLPPMRWDKFKIKNLKLKIPELPNKKIKRFVKQYGLSEYNARILTETKEKADYFEEAYRRVQPVETTTPKDIANVIINKKVDIKKISPVHLMEMISREKTKKKMPNVQIQQVVEQVIKNNQKVVVDYRQGKKTAIEFLVGQVMKQTKGQAEPNQTRKLLLEKLR